MMLSQESSGSLGGAQTGTRIQNLASLDTQEMPEMAASPNPTADIIGFSGRWYARNDSWTLWFS